MEARAMPGQLDAAPARPARTGLLVAVWLATIGYLVVELSFNARLLDVVGGSASAPTFSGSFNISRKAFGIGDPVWDGTVDDQILIKFNMSAGR